MENFTPEASVVLNFAQLEAANRMHEFFTLEHLLLGLLHDDSIRAMVLRLGSSADRIAEKLRTLMDTFDKVERHQTPGLPSPSVRRVITRAHSYSVHARSTPVSSVALFLHLFDESDSAAVSLLESEGIRKVDVKVYLSHQETGLPVARRRTGESPEPGGEESGEAASDDAGSALDLYTTNLNEEARSGRIDRLVGRDAEVEQAVRVLARRRKNNPLFVGESGVGKTAIAEGIALRIVQGEVPEALQDSTVYALDMGSLIAGTRYRGDFEERMKKVISELQEVPGGVLFIDEIHTIVGAGQTHGGTMDASNLLKPALANGRMRCMGSTTFKEYRTAFEKDRALSRRFQKIDVVEPSEAEAIEILRGLQPAYESFHGVTYEPDAIEKCVRLSAKHITDRHLPDKAIDLLDEAGAYVKLDASREKVVVATDIQTIISKVARIPNEEVSLSDRDRLRVLHSDLGAVVFGQDEAVREVVSAVKLARSGLNSPDRPLGAFLFTGPTGVGKTEVARQLAKTLGIELIRFDMSEYMEAHSVSRLIGAPPGYVGFDQGGLLTEAVTKNPHAVLLLDEIEKAHPDVFNILLQVMDAGRLTDNNGRTADFRNVLLIMTSNVGARDLVESEIGFSRVGRLGDDDKAFRAAFSPEFRNRLDARIRFQSLDPSVMDRIVRKFIDELALQLRSRGVELTLSPAAVERLAKEGYDPLMGARPMARVIKTRLKLPMADELLFGAIADGGTVEVDVADEALTFVYRSARKALPGPEPDEAANNTASEDAAPTNDDAVTAESP
jgi:ATP-dependent Clp protease ATP-binding subunit ClpA